MIFLCYITNILSAANSSGSDLLIDKNTGDKKDGTNTTTQGMISADAYNARNSPVNNDMLSDNTKIDSIAVPADLTQTGGNKLQDADMNSEDILNDAKHNPLQKDEPKKQNKVCLLDANGNVRDTRYNNKPLDANNIGSDARLANSSNEFKDGNNARKTAADDSNTSRNDAEEAKTQQAYEDHIRVNQSKYRVWLKERYDKYLSMGGMQNTTIEYALAKQVTWKEYQNLRRFLELEIERFNGAHRNGLNNTSKHIAIHLNGKPSVDGHLQVRGNFATAEKVGNKATPAADDKNDMSQTQPNTKVTQNQEIEKQENTTNTQEKGIPDEEKKQKINPENLQNDAKNVMQERADHEPKNQTATGENKTGNIWNHEPIKHYSATKNRRSATMNTNLKKNDKNKNIAKSKAANKKSDTKKKDEKSFYQRNRMLIIILSLVGVCALTLGSLWFYLSQKAKQ